MYDVCTYVIVSHYNDILPVHWICWPPLAKHVPSHPFCLLISKALKVLGILLCMAGNAATLLGNDTQSSQKGPQRTEEGVTPSWGVGRKVPQKVKLVLLWSTMACPIYNISIYTRIYVQMYIYIYVYITKAIHQAAAQSSKKRYLVAAVRRFLHRRWTPRPTRCGKRSAWGIHHRESISSLQNWCVGPYWLMTGTPTRAWTSSSGWVNCRHWAKSFCHKINIFWLQSMQNSSGRRLKKGPKLLTRAPCGRLRAPW